ncbi:hypothetical protein AS149_14730 [Burkholderia cenocepacia]|nr:hypothetical protein AS149_14730 [Burkholderia cenocepacia]
MVETVEQSSRRRLFDTPAKPVASSPAQTEQRSLSVHDVAQRTVRVAPAVLQAMEIARRQYGELVSRNEPRFRRKLEQLMLWDLATVTQWGTDEADRQGDIAARVATQVRDFSILNASEQLEKIVKNATMPLSKLDKFLGVERNIDGSRVELDGIRAALTAMRPGVVELATEQSETCDELLLLVGALAIAVEVFGEPKDRTTAQALDQRRRSLQMSLQQAQKLKESLEGMKGLIVRLCGDISHAVTVTLTNAKLVQAQSR